MNKGKLTWLVALGTLGGILQQAQAVVIPDGNPSGLSLTQTISSSITAITSVSVNLNLSAEYNGDLYVYLQHGDAITVLLNRTGSTLGNPSGYGDSGFQITLSDSAANGDIHTYQSVTTPADGSPLTGGWQPDARLADPDAVTDGSARSAYLNVFNGLAASGDWTLFVADLSTGGASAVNSWSLEFTGRQTHVPDAGQIPLAMQMALTGLLTWAARKK
jgi:subtilisin-like proprotein convertase family protein